MAAPGGPASPSPGPEAWLGWLLQALATVAPSATPGTEAAGGPQQWGSLLGQEFNPGQLWRSVLPFGQDEREQASLVVKSLRTSKYAVGLGVLAAVGDAAVQGVALWLEPHCRRAGQQPGHWRTARTFRAFTYGGTAGMLLSLGNLVLLERRPPLVILPQFVPCELLLLPFQYVIYKGQDSHVTRNMTYYMLVYTLLNLMVYIPTELLSIYWKSDALTLVAISLEQMWLGFVAVGHLLFFNRYPEWQWSVPLPLNASKALRWSNTALIRSTRVFGNMSVVFLTVDVILKDSITFPFTPTLPLWFAQILVNTQSQLAAEDKLPTAVKVLRILSIVLALPACSLNVKGYLPSLESVANVMAFSAFSLWIGTFNREWSELYTAVEGPQAEDEADWWVDHLFDRNAFLRLREKPSPDATETPAEPQQAGRVDVPQPVADVASSVPEQPSAASPALATQGSTTTSC